MKNIWKWIIGIVVVLVVLFALPFVWRLIFPYYGYGMTPVTGVTPFHGALCGFGRHMPMMGGFGFMPFGFFMWLIPLGTLVLLVLGIVWIVETLSSRANPPARVCARCGKPSQPDWKTCPYCIKPL